MQAFFDSAPNTASSQNSRPHFFLNGKSAPRAYLFLTLNPEISFLCFCQHPRRVMAEAAGLVLGVLGVAGLFSTCIECFDIVVAGKNFSEDYEQLCALVGQGPPKFLSVS
jgi:hypothetical protein